jgi:tetratricopeptide (TPR) repeat protein
MYFDRFGLAIATAHGGAIAAFENATLAVAAHRPGVPLEIAVALEAAPDFVAARALLGFAQVMLARSETVAAATGSLMMARDARGRSGASTSENAMVEALALAAQGGLAAAADRLEAHLETNPGEFLIAKLAHSLRFMTGDAMGMLTSVDRTLMALSKDHPGHGFMLGCRAFALEELGAFDGAEKLGRQAVEIEPQDSWAIHAVGHVHEMTGRAADGLAWIESRRPTWTNCNNFALHMSWHAALLHLELGRVGRALEIFDREVWPRASDDFRDMSNAVALLARIEQFGVDVGDRWQGPAAIAAARVDDATLTFAALHNLVALVASGSLSAARDLAATLDKATHEADDQESVRAAVGRPLARAILSLADQANRPIDFTSILRDLPRVGGSNAQRDVFTRMLACMAADRRDGAALETILGVRRNLKRDDSFAALVRARFTAAEPQRLTA